MRRDVEISYSNICRACLPGCAKCYGPSSSECILFDNSINDGIIASSVNNETKQFLTIFLNSFILIIMIILLITVGYMLHQKIVFIRNTKQRNNSKFQYKTLTQNIDELTPLPQAQQDDENEEQLVRILS